MNQNRNHRKNSRIRQRAIARRRRRRVWLITLLTILCLGATVFALRIPQQIYAMVFVPVDEMGDRETGTIRVGLHNEDNAAAKSSLKESRLEDSPEKTATLQEEPVSSDKQIEDIGSQIDLSGLYSPYAILIRADTGELVAAKNENTRIYPASLTKIMTAVLVLENISDWETSLTMPTEIYASLYAEDASMAGFEAGETVTVRELLYGVLLPSGAECCQALAIQVAGSADAFVSMMNEKAGELGLENTHFCNTTGLHNEDHYTTVKEMAVLLRYALQNDHFREIFTAHRFSTRPSNVHGEGITFYSTLFKYMETAAVTGGEITGGKTGYTGQAGLCLASSATVNGLEYILVTAKADGNHETEQFHITDAKNIYNQLGTLTQ